MRSSEWVLSSSGLLAASPSHSHLSQPQLRAAACLFGHCLAICDTLILKSPCSTYADCQLWLASSSSTQQSWCFFNFHSGGGSWNGTDRASKGNFEGGLQNKSTTGTLLGTGVPWMKTLVWQGDKPLLLVFPLFLKHVQKQGLIYQLLPLFAAFSTRCKIGIGNNWGRNCCDGKEELPPSMPSFLKWHSGEIHPPGSSVENPCCRFEKQLIKY